MKLEGSNTSNVFIYFCKYKLIVLMQTIIHNRKKVPRSIKWPGYNMKCFGKHIVYYMQWALHRETQFTFLKHEYI